VLTLHIIYPYTVDIAYEVALGFAQLTSFMTAENIKTGNSGIQYHAHLPVAFHCSTHRDLTVLPPEFTTKYHQIELL